METENRFELKITKSQPGAIEWNFDSLKKAITERVADYKDVVYTDDQIAEAKEDRATLGRLSDSINRRRLELKKSFNEPFTLFEKQCKELTGIIDDAKAGIDRQVKEYEDGLKQKKREAIEAYWNAAGFVVVPDIAIIWNERWLNKTYSEKQWKADLDEIIKRVKNEIETLTMTDDVEEASFCIPYYNRCLDYGKTVAAWHEKKAEEERNAELLRQAEEQRKAREEAERLRQEAAEKARAEMLARRAANVARPPIIETPPAYRVTDPEPAPPTGFPEVLTRYIKVEVTKKQLIALANFMQANGIKFEKVEM